MENVEFAFVVIITGFFLVLLTLFLLYLLLTLFGRVFSRSGKENAIKPDADNKKPGLTQSFLPPQLKAAITAAVYQYLSEPVKGNPRIKLTIRQDHTPTRSGWAAAGRKALLESRWELELLRRKKGYEKI